MHMHFAFVQMRPATCISQVVPTAIAGYLRLGLIRLLMEGESLMLFWQSSAVPAAWPGLPVMVDDWRMRQPLLAQMHPGTFIWQDRRPALTELLLQGLIRLLMAEEIMMRSWLNSLVPAHFHGQPIMEEVVTILLMVQIQMLSGISLLLVAPTAIAA